MSGLFYRLGRHLGRAAVPAIRRGRWIWNGLTGTEEEALRAEQSLGAALAVEVRGATQPSGDMRAGELVSGLGRRLAAQAKDPRRVFRIEVIGDGSPNAMALPGGYIFVSQALIDLCGRDPDELAFVVGHEMAHVLLGHAWDRLLSQGLFQAASLVVGRAGPLGPWVRQNGLVVLRSAYARNGELEADATGLELARAAGFNPAGAISLLRRLEQLGPDPGVVGQYFASHPAAADRLRALNPRIGA